MKTHEFADALEHLIRILRQAPNADMSSLGERLRPTTGSETNRRIAVNLSTLSALSRLDRGQWAAFVEDYSMPLQIRPRDASRDILGKVLRYLDENPSARQRLKDQAAGKEAPASPELMKALSLLLKEEND